MLVVSTILVRPLLELELPFHYYTIFFICLLLISTFDRLLVKKKVHVVLLVAALCFATAFELINLCDRSQEISDEICFFPANLDPLFEALSAPVAALRFFLSAVGLTVPWPIGVVVSIALLTVLWGLVVYAFAQLIGAASQTSLQPTPSEASAKKDENQIALALLAVAAVIAFIVRIHVLLRFRVPVGCDTPFYISTMQGKIPSEWYGGILRRPLYAFIKAAGVVLDLKSPILPLNQAYVVEVFPAILLCVVAATTYGLAYSISRRPSISFLSSFFATTSLGILRVTWDLYKLLTALPLAITSLHLLYRSITWGGLRNYLLFLFVFSLTALNHATAAGIVLPTAVVYPCMLWVASQNPLQKLSRCTTYLSYLSRKPRIEAYSAAKLCLKKAAKPIAAILLASALVALVYPLIAHIFAYAESGWYPFRITSPWGEGAGDWAPILHDVAVYNELALPLSLLAVVYVRKKRADLFFASFVVSTLILLYNAKLGIDLPATGQIPRLISIAGVPLGIAAAYGVVQLVNPLLAKKNKAIKYSSLACLFVITAIAGRMAHSYVYHGGLLPFIDEPGLVATNWLMKHAPHPCNSKAPQRMDSWTGDYYAGLQQHVEKPYYYINPWQYECEFEKEHLIYNSKAVEIYLEP